MGREAVQSLQSYRGDFCLVLSLGEQGARTECKARISPFFLSATVPQRSTSVLRSTEKRFGTSTDERNWDAHNTRRATCKYLVGQAG